MIIVDVNVVIAGRRLHHPHHAVAQEWIAAIAVEDGASVASFDRDFARFPGLRWIVPD